MLDEGVDSSRTIEEEKVDRFEEETLVGNDIDDSLSFFVLIDDELQSGKEVLKLRVTIKYRRDLVKQKSITISRSFLHPSRNSFSFFSLHLLQNSFDTRLIHQSSS